jgi:hypothetical protein
MFSRITFILITVFWLCMNFLLWRSEFAWRNHIGVKIPVSVVWQKILTAPDNSGLLILHHGKETGRCQWSPNIGQELTASRMLTDGVPVDGPVPEPTGYRVQFDGSFSMLTAPSRLGFGFDITFTTNRDWQECEAGFKLHPGSDSWSFHAKASAKTLRFRMDSQGENFDHVYKFSELQNPQFLLQEFQLHVPFQLLDSLNAPAAGKPAAPLALGLEWEARSDWVTLGHTSVRAYRLQARLFDRFHIIIMVSQVGEILRVELPDEWALVNTQFSEL